MAVKGAASNTPIKPQIIPQNIKDKIMVIGCRPKLSPNIFGSRKLPTTWWTIVGKRIKRSEGIFFKFCYFTHKLIVFTFTGESIKYGNYTCLPKLVVEKMVNEKATWSSFSGALAKVAKDRAGVSSERGTRYFGPSKMSFKNLIIHSLSIISVFKINVLMRSILFLLVYIFLIYQKISIIMIIPIILVLALLASVFVVSKRESFEELNNSLLNISNIDKIK